MSELGAAFGVLIVCLAGFVLWLLCLPGEPLQWREIEVPDRLTADQVEAVLRHVAGARHGPVVFGVHARVGDVRLLVGAPERALSSLMAAASGLAPELRFEEPAEPASGGSTGSSKGFSFGARISWAGPWPLLRNDTPELSVAGLLGALASVEPGEQLQLMVRLWPVGRVHRPVAASERSEVPPNPWFMRLWWPAQPPREDIHAIRAKFSDLLLRAEVIVGATAGSRLRTRALTHRVIAAARVSSGSRGVLRWRPVRSAKRLLEVVARRRSPWPWEPSTLLSAPELVALVGLPIEAPSVAGISYGVGPRLMPPMALPTTGRVFAVSTWPSTAGRPLAQPVLGGLQHAAVVGPTGSGKSVLVSRLVEQDMAAGRGALVIDIKGDLVSDLLARIPARRRDDVIVLEPARSGPQPGLRLFAPGGDTELTADLLLGTLRELFADSWGVRSSQYLGLGLRTLAGMPGATLMDLPRLFHDQHFRAQALSAVRDSWLLAAWQRFDALSPGDRAAQLSSPLSKLEELIGRKRLRLVLGQRDSRLDFADVLANRRIVLVSLPPGLLGTPATRLLAALTLWQFFQAVEARAALPPERRSPFMAYIDEVAVLASLPLPLEGLLERARGHGVGVTLSPQAVSQLSQSLRASLLANVGSLVAFRQTGEEEANVLAKALPGVTPPQLQHLGAFEVAMRLSLGPGRSTLPMTGQTLPPSEPRSDATEMRRVAGERFGRAVEDVDGEHDARQPHGSAGDGGTRLGVSRRRR